MSRGKRKRLRQVPGTLMPTPERLAKTGRSYDELTEASAGGVLKKTGAIRVWTPLENLYRNRRISGEQHDAGIRFYADWYIGLEAGTGITMRWSEYISGLGSGGGNMGAAERRVFHAKRYAAANRLLEEMGVRKAVHWLVINEIPAEVIGRRSHGYRLARAASASGVTMVSLGLTRLAKFYGISK